MDSLHDYLVPFFSNLTFYTRKKVDFSNWVIVVKMHKFGYYVLPEGKSLILKIITNSNKLRYFNNTTITTINTAQAVIDLFSLDPPFDVSSGFNHTLLAQKYYRDLGSRKGFQVYVYVDGIELASSPFSSYHAATKALGLSNKIGAS